MSNYPENLDNKCLKLKNCNEWLLWTTIVGLIVYALFIYFSEHVPSKYELICCISVLFVSILIQRRNQSIIYRKPDHK